MSERIRSEDRSHAVLVVSGLSKAYGQTQALSDVDFSLRRNTVHGVVGRNGAGKSTLVGCLVGDVVPDAGTIEISRSLLATSPGDRENFSLEPCEGLKLQQQVTAVYQQLKLVPHLSVAENLQLGLLPHPWVRWGAVRRRAQEVVSEWELDVDVRQPVHELRTDQRQLVSIARALMTGSRIVLLDEPTSRLNWLETEALFSHVRALTTRGVSFMFISHSLREVMELCDDVTVLRDGRVVASGPKPTFTESDLVWKMSATDDGRLRGTNSRSKVRPTAQSSRQPLRDSPVLLRVSELSVERRVDSVSLELRRGEWLGLTGLVGSGATALASAIAGFERRTAGEVTLNGTKIPAGRVDRAIGAGIGFVAPDRHENGLIPTFSVGANISIASLDRFSRFGFVTGQGIKRLEREGVAELDVKTEGIDAPINSLSGGNQQKVLIARAVETDPQLVVFVNPTVGVDIASKNMIYEWMRSARDRGISGIIASEDELADFEICDRVTVLREGAIAAEFGSDRTASEILAAIEGYSYTESE